MEDLTALLAEIERQKTVDDSVKALITQLVALKGDPVALAAAVSALAANNDDVAAAVTANTPVA